MDCWDSLIEATIDAIHVDVANKVVRIDVRCVCGDLERQQIVATGVDDFLANEMRLTNIIDRVTLFNAESPSNDDLARRLYLLMRGTEPTRTDLGEPAVVEKMARIKSGVLCLLEVEPVYGAGMLILATRVALECER